MSNPPAIKPDAFAMISHYFDVYGTDYAKWSGEALSLYHQHKDHKDVLALATSAQTLGAALKGSKSPTLSNHVKQDVLNAFHEVHSPKKSSFDLGAIFKKLMNWQLPAAAGAGMVAASIGVVMAVSLEPVITPEEELSYYLIEVDDYTDFETNGDGRDAS